MTLRSSYSIILMACLSFGILDMGGVNSAHATQIVGTKKIQGKVTDVIDVTSYTYVEVDTGSEKIWAAAPTTKVKIGDTVSFSTKMPMEDFYSDSINRNFPLIYFINGFITDTNKVPSLNNPSPHAKINQVRQTLRIRNLITYET